MIYGPLDLLIVQGTPFCNIDCKYCYLPDRLSTKKISLETFDNALTKILESDLVRKDFSVVWHAGEPLVLPITFYEAATDLIAKRNKTEFKVNQTIQTNGILLSDDWCEFIKENNINIGVSLDGPEIIHDKQRIDRQGRGTHRKVVAGIDLLKKRDIQFYVIAVITDVTLNHPDEFFNYFLNLGVKRLCLNIEEAEGVHSKSSLVADDFDNRFKAFFNRLYDLYTKHKTEIDIREFSQIEKLILKGDLNPSLGQQTTPFRILTLDTDGSFSTFSPELLGMNGEHHEDFRLGNLNTECLNSVISSKKLTGILEEILIGIIACKKSCEYFSVCGGGTPSNKFSEHKKFDATETNFCRLRNKSLFDVVFSKFAISNTVTIGLTNHSSGTPNGAH